MSQSESAKAEIKRQQVETLKQRRVDELTAKIRKEMRFFIANHVVHDNIDLALKVDKEKVILDVMEAMLREFGRAT